MPSSIAARTPLHAALSAFHVAGVRLLFISRRAMDQLIRASLSHTHHWYEVGMLKVPADDVRIQPI